MTNTEIIEAWLGSHDLNPLWGWDLCVEEAVTSCLDFEQVNGMSAEDAARAVMEAVENVQDAPEEYGVSFPVYNPDIRDIWENNDSYVEAAFAEACDGHADSVWGAVCDGVNWACVYAAQEAASALMADIDNLEELLSNAG